MPSALSDRRLVGLLPIPEADLVYIAGQGLSPITIDRNQKRLIHVLNLDYWRL